MGLIYCSDGCNWLEYWDNGRQARCREKRDCVCRACGPLQAMNLNLYESCANACNAENSEDRPLDKDSFLGKYNAGDLYKMYGIIVKGFDPTKTVEYNENKLKQERISEQEIFQRNILYGVLLIFCGFLIYIFFV